MGKGGKNQSKMMKLSGLTTEELEKWVSAYGVKVDTKDREKMLEELNPYADGILDKNRPPLNLPLDPPPFTLATVKNAIPPHCFKRNLFTSLTHLASDLSIIATFAYLATYFNHPSLPIWSSYILWPMYWYAQGAVMTGVWVLAHECGHQSFSESEFWNNTFGTILHSLLLVPYHSWRITHSKHHGNTGSCANDEVFAPTTRSEWAGEMLRETPIANLWGIILMLTVGWPAYITIGVTGPSKYKGQNVNHFSPSAVFFKPEEYWLIVQTDIAFIIVVSIMAYFISIYGVQAYLAYYFIPYLVTNYHLVLITYLQHTDVYSPHFRNKEWNWFRGALCTIDRSFGPILDHTFHHITDTHVVHHLFSSMPFYHAQEATEAVRKVLGPYYLKDDTPIALALYRAFSSCQYVEDDGDIVFYKNIK